MEVVSIVAKTKMVAIFVNVTTDFSQTAMGKHAPVSCPKVILKKNRLNNLCETQMRGNLSSMRGNSRYILFPNLVADLVNCLFCSKCFLKEATKKLDIPGFCLLEEFLKMLSKNTVIQKTSESFQKGIYGKKVLKHFQNINNGSVMGVFLEFSQKFY